MNKSPNKSLIAECSRFLQAIAQLDVCAYCGFPSDPYKFRGLVAGHHEIGRARKFFMHDMRVIVPLCYEDHTEQAHGDPERWADWMFNHRPEQHAWITKTKREMNENPYSYKNPDRAALLKTLANLKALHAKGEPFVWTNTIIQEQ